MHAATGEILRIATWNMHHGAQPRQQPTDFVAYQRACEKLRDLRLDILGLQEVEKGVRRSGRKDLTEIAANITGLTAKFSRARWWDLGGQVGHALLVRGEIQNTHTLRLNGDRRHPIKIKDRPVHWGGHPLHWMFERRNVLFADVTVRGHNLAVANTHYGGTETVRQQSTLKALGALIAVGGSRPLVFIGDLNTDAIVLENWVKPTGMELAGRKGIATYNKRHIDHVALRGLAVRDVWTENLGVSDHRLLVVEAELPTFSLQGA